MTQVESGREQQRRRTRAAIVDAAGRLLAAGDDEPSVGAIAAEAGVSRRTIYGYFPTLDQLLLDATAGAIGAEVDVALDQLRHHPDPRVRVTRMLEAVCDNAERSLPLGRRLIRLTVDAPVPADGGPKRGYRRVGWIERALEPLRDELSPRRFADLVSELAVVTGWEAFIVLTDLRGLTPAQARAAVLRMGLALVDAALAAPRRRPADR